MRPVSAPGGIYDWHPARHEDGPLRTVRTGAVEAGAVESGIGLVVLPKGVFVGDTFGVSNAMKQ